MNNYINKMAINKLKEMKKTLLVLFSVVLIFTTALIVLVNITYMKDHNTYLNNLDSYGSYHYVIIDPSAKVVDELNHSNLVQERNTLYQYGGFEYGSIGSIEAYDLLPIQLISGNMPEKADEIVLEEEILAIYSSTQTLGQAIPLTYIDNNGEEITKTYTLVGIMENYMNSIPVSLQAIVAKQNTSSVQTIYFTTISHSYSSTIDDINLVKNTVYDQNTTQIISTRSSMLSFTLIMTLLIFSGVNQINEENKSDITLLRGIGAKKGQVIKYVYIQSALVFIGSLILSLILGIGISILYGILTGLSISLGLETMIEIVIIFIIGIGLGTLIPAIKLANISLTGSIRKKHRRVKSSKKKKITAKLIASRYVFDHFVTYLVSLILLTFALYTIQTNLKVLVNHTEYNYSSDIHFRSWNNSVLSYLENNKEIERLDHYRTSTNVLYYQDVYKNIPNSYANLNYAIASGFIQNEENTVTLIQYDFDEEELNQLGMNAEDYLSGKCCIVYTPEVMVINNGFMKPNNEYLGEYTLVKNTTLKQGDLVTISNQTISIGGFIENLDYDLEDYIFPNTIFISTQCMPLTATADYYYITLKNQSSHSAIANRLNYYLNVESVYLTDEIQEEINHELTQHQEKTNSLMKIVSCIGIIVIILFQLQQTDYDELNRQITTLRILGMEKAKVKTIMITLGSLLGIIVIILSFITSFIIKLLSYNSLYQYYYIDELLHFELLFDQTDLILITITSILLLVSIITSYYLNSKKLMHSELLSQLRNKE